MNAASTAASAVPGRRVWLVAAPWAAVCALLYSTLAILRHRRLEPTSWDNAIFEQALRGYADLGWPIVDIKGPGYNLLGDHFHPIVALLAPVYRLFPAAETLLLAQAVLLAISVHVVTALAVRHLGRRVGLALGVAYGLSFGLISAVAAQFHEVAFGAPLLALAGAAYVERRWTAVVLWTLPLLLVKEDLGITVAVVGLVLWLAGQRRRGLLLAGVGLVGAALVVFVVLPAFNPAGVYDYATNAGGDDGLAITLFTGVDRKLLTVLLTFGVTGLSALFSRWALLVLPTFAWRFVGDVEFYWGTDWHYSLLLMPIVFVAAIDAMVRHRELRWATVPALVVTAVMLIGSPMASLVDSTTWREGPREAAAAAVIRDVPQDASVVTDIGLITHLGTERQVFWLGTVGDASPDFVLLDQWGGFGAPPDILEYASTTFGGSWELVRDEQGYQLARRTGSDA
ncbi:DUF2079 domain-containing protein [Aeromicrobium sp. CTD01-1L150]|uniref:DUF2079 domain-containing protein n=1 Tax=Aeromicrobium sp. CTD01-1L150 TaxID=3341830 RepID=UPI0035C09D84